MARAVSFSISAVIPKIVIIPSQIKTGCQQARLGLNSICSSQHETVGFKICFNMSKGMLGPRLSAIIDLFGRFILRFESQLVLFMR